MANTRDLIGETETLDGLISHSLDNFEDDRIAYLRRSAFYGNDTLKSVTLPFCKGTIANSFYNCYQIENISLPLLSILNQYDFSYCYKLKNLSIPLLSGIYGEYALSSCYSLNDLDLSKVTRVSFNALRHSGFGTITLPSCTNFGAIGENFRLSTLDLGQQMTFSGSMFSNVYSLCHLILRSESICTLSESFVFNNTPIANGIGWIYVPSDLVESYKTASNWSIYANQIVSLDEYPKALSGETITDSWDEIFLAESDGSYKTKYSVGDTKYLVVGGTYVLMQIVAFDRDILSSDHTSTAKITWLAKSLSFEFSMNFAHVTKGGWADCECRKFLSDTIYEQIPENVRNKILAVDKTYTTTSSSSSTATISDKLWIPSMGEIYGSSTGIDYTDFFTDNSVRQKHNGLLTNNAYYWWLRSVSSSTAFHDVDIGGGVRYNNAFYNYGVALGFCT